ncbi:hypothetical protein BJF85_05790 [Saccharomonospora sp. CUA-673]|nr:hypothetical protein BJF85_05790 [Saccharomonospora sp. CUA-673]
MYHPPSLPGSDSNSTAPNSSSIGCLPWMKFGVARMTSFPAVVAYTSAPSGSCSSDTSSTPTPGLPTNTSASTSSSASRAA